MAELRNRLTVLFWSFLTVLYLVATPLVAQPVPDSTLTTPPDPRTTFDLHASYRSDSLAVDSARTDSIRPGFTRSFYEGMRRALLFGAHQLVLIDSTLAIPADSTRFDTTMVGQVGGGALYVSRQIYKGVLLAFDYGVTAVEPERIIQLQDFFRLPESPWGWYPIVVGTSYYRVKLGSKVYYRSKTFGGSVDGGVAGIGKWNTRLRFTLRDASERQVRQANLTLQRRQDDDMQFYGIGQHPGSDPRSHFKPGTKEEYGVFHQDFQQAQLILGLRASRYFEFRGTWIYQKRRIMLNWDEDQSLPRVFDVDALPGARGDVTDLYQEIAVRFDNTSGLEGRGAALELYGGIVNGLGDDRRFLRYGFDVHKYMRIFGNHYLVPRIVTNIVRPYHSSDPLNFTDYPRHPTFRAASDRKFIKSDNVVLVPAIDVHNRLTKNLTGRVFIDYLLATPSIDKLDLDDGVIGVGAGLVIYTRYTDVAGLIVSYSELGPRISLFVGTEPNRNERSRWR